MIGATRGFWTEGEGVVGAGAGDEAGAANIEKKSSGLEGAAVEETVAAEG